MNLLTNNRLGLKSFSYKTLYLICLKFKKLRKKFHDIFCSSSSRQTQSKSSEQKVRVYCWIIDMYRREVLPLSFLRYFPQADILLGQACIVAFQVFSDFIYLMIKTFNINLHDLT